MDSSSSSQNNADSSFARNKTYEYYGFVIYLMSFVVYGGFLIWAYIPDEILHSLGIYYYPSKYWAIAIPAWTIGLVIFIYLLFIAFTLQSTAPVNSLQILTDDYAMLYSPATSVPQHRVSQFTDLSVRAASQCLYGDLRPEDLPLGVTDGDT